MLIFHMVLPERWAEFDTGIYRAASLETEGFIHCSYAEQLDRVIERYYKNEKRLIILSLDTDKLMSRVVHEPSTGDEIYPHIYGPVNRDAIVAVEEKKR
jgi:uncharacterized protein (DUF952 family)